MAIQVRKMVPSDLESVVTIEEQSFPNPWTRGQLELEMDRTPFSRCFVAVKEAADLSRSFPRDASGREVAGFITAWLVEDELHITNLAVAREARGQGVARALLDRSIQEAAQEGVTWCQLEVRVSNEPAVKLYRRSGFESLGIRKGYYQNGEDAVVMGKEIKEGRR